MLEKLAGSCSDGVTCPNIWAEDGDTVIVQGYAATIEVLPAAPDGEARVRIPRSMLVEAAAKVQ